MKNKEEPATGTPVKLAAHGAALPRRRRKLQGPAAIDDNAGSVDARWRESGVAVAGSSLRLRKVEDGDYPLLTSWMNDPDVAEFWLLAGPEELTRAHVAYVSADGHSVSYLGFLDDEPMSYWELYRADLDPLAAHYAAEAYDGGIHVLLGPSRYRGKGLGPQLLETVARGMFAEEPRMRRIVAEPDLRNERSVRAFERAGFRQVGELELPIKTAALMVKERDGVVTR